jgi:nicotinate-nucleotide pyrophosphorylase
MLTNEILESIQRALTEDIGTGDLTTLAFVPAKRVFEGYMVARQAGIFKRVRRGML